MEKITDAIGLANLLEKIDKSLDKIDNKERAGRQKRPEGGSRQMKIAGDLIARQEG